MTHGQGILFSFCIASLLTLSACTWHSKQREKTLLLSSFAWKNCGAPDDPAVMKSLSIQPDPIKIPGKVVASASGKTTVPLASPLSMNVSLEKEVAGFWVKIPCLEQLGSCHYPDGCSLLDMLIPPGQECPEPLHTYGIPCHCPFKAGDYSLPQSEIQLPDIELPFWLTNGNYRAQGVVASNGKEMGCLKVALSVHSAK